MQDGSAPKLDIEAILRTLAERGVDFIIVGGVCAVLHGAPITTFDLDIVHSRSRENVDRLIEALQDLEAHYRHLPERQAVPAKSHLSSRGHQLLMTRFGPLDVLGEIGKRQSYADLLPRTVEMLVGKGIEVRVLDLRTLIQTKQATAGEKDLGALAILRRILHEEPGA